MGWLDADREKYATLATAWVLPAAGRCVQCGVCSFNCPMAIDVRGHVWRGEPVHDGRCLTCGECVKRCPRGLLRFEPLAAGPEAGGAGATAPSTQPES
jgi:ferredoxin